ncbi:MAG: histidine kinase [Microbacterium sp.]
MEGVGLLALAGWQAVALAGGDTESAISSVALLVLTVVGAVSVLAFAAAVARGRSWGRSGGVVTQLLLLAVALGAATGQYAHPLVGLALAVPAAVCLVLLMAAARRAARSGDG